MLSATVEVGGGSARVDRTTFNGSISLYVFNCENAGRKNDMSRWRNRPAPPLVDNPAVTQDRVSQYLVHVQLLSQLTFDYQLSDLQGRDGRDRGSKS